MPSFSSTTLWHINRLEFGAKKYSNNNHSVLSTSVLHNVHFRSIVDSIIITPSSLLVSIGFEVLLHKEFFFNPYGQYDNPESTSWSVICLVEREFSLIRVIVWPFGFVVIFILLIVILFHSIVIVRVLSVQS